jgi:outer membrane receptor protein involved in Fe transport
MSNYARTDVRVTYTIDKRFEVYGEIINVLDRENFRVLLEDVSPVNARPIEYQIEPAFPRLFTYGVRFKF